MIGNLPTLKNSKLAYLPHLHHFRGIAILFIIMVHAHDCLNWSENRTTGDILYAFLTRSTILFVFISGYLFQHLSGRFQFQEYLQKKLKQVIIPYLIISVPIIVFRIITNEIPPEIEVNFPQFAGFPLAGKVLFYYLTGAHLIPFWFIPMICIYYLMAPVFIKLDRNGILYYLLPVLLIVSLLIGRKFLFDIPRMFIHFLPVYITGMFASRYKDKISSISRQAWPWLTAATVALLGITIFMYNTAFREQIVFIQKLFFCWFFIYWLEQVQRYMPRFIDKLAEVSFGLFFIHYYFLFLFRAISKFLTRTSLPDGSFLYLILLFVAVISLSFITLWIVKKIVGSESKLIIGY